MLNLCQAFYDMVVVFMVLTHPQLTISILFCLPSFFKIRAYPWSFLCMCSVGVYCQPKEPTYLLPPPCWTYIKCFTIWRRCGWFWITISSQFPSLSVSPILVKSGHTLEGCGWCWYIVAAAKGSKTGDVSTFMLDLSQVFTPQLTISILFVSPALVKSGPTLEGCGWYEWIVAAVQD